jgi:hypothetical protein
LPGRESITRPTLAFILIGLLPVIAVAEGSNEPLRVVPSSDVLAKSKLVSLLISTTALLWVI